MREIKFRAWDKRNNMMADLGHVVIDRKSKYNAYAVLGGLTHGDDYELMQYTGLKDSQGVEIYEGDILMTEDGLYSAPVTYEEPSFVAIVPNHRELNRSGVLDILWTSSEVIGNIYENPELLKTKE